MTRTMKIARVGGGGMIQRQPATSTGGRDRYRDGDNKDNNDHAWQWPREDATLMHDINRQRGQGQGQG
jgi:hypothetical protein